MKIGIHGGEAFPVYSIHRDGFQEIEVDEHTLEKWHAAFEVFEKAQQEIIDKLEEQGHETWSNGSWCGYNI